jgi:hypothetical protein
LYEKQQKERRKEERKRAAERKKEEREAKAREREELKVRKQQEKDAATTGRSAQQAKTPIQQRHEALHLNLRRDVVHWVM